jgi:hypothetical protein
MPRLEIPSSGPLLAVPEQGSDGVLGSRACSKRGEYHATQRRQRAVGLAVEVADLAGLLERKVNFLGGERSPIGAFEVFNYCTLFLCHFQSITSSSATTIASPTRCRNDTRVDSGRRTAEQRDELASFHSITSSARASRDGGAVRPRALAVVRFTTSSNLVGCSTGMLTRNNKCIGATLERLDSGRDILRTADFNYAPSL